MISSKFLSFLAILATGAVATNPPNRDWIVEIRTGKGTDYQPLSQMVPIPQGQLIDDTNCSIHVAGESGGVKQNVNPVMTIAGGVPACEVGSRLTGDVYGFGRFSINFLPNNETCDTVTDSCRPLLMYVLLLSIVKFFLAVD